MQATHDQSGMALVAALITVALCVSLATWILLNEHHVIRKAHSVMQIERMMHQLPRVEAWALALISESTHLRHVKDFHQLSAGIELRGHLTALGGRFNLNLLADTRYLPSFSRLLALVLSDLSPQQRDDLVMYLHDWLIAGENDAWYAHLSPAYRQAHQRLARVSELRAVRGFTPRIYSRLLGGDDAYVTALPTLSHRINLNDATAPVFVAMLNLSLTEAEALVNCRQRHFYTSVAAFMHDCATGIIMDSSLLTTEDTSYLLVASASNDGKTLPMTALIVVDSIEKIPRIVWEEYTNA